MKCPIHGEELREEWAGEQGHIGFCFRCMKKYPFCSAVNYMDPCDKIKDHDGKHRTKGGLEFEVKT